jgi:hypothetical protein
VPAAVFHHRRARRPPPFDLGLTTIHNILAGNFLANSTH